MVEVKVNPDKGRLRLTWSLSGRRYNLYLGLEDTKTNRLKAASTKLQIEADIEQDCFDSSLVKYKICKNQGEKPSQDTCAEAFRRWIAYKSTFVDANTVSWYGQTLSYVTKLLPNTKASLLTKAEANLFTQKIKELGLHLETIKRKIENLAAAWKWNIENNYLTIKTNPWKGLSKQIKAPPPLPPEPFTQTEAKAIIDGFRAHSRYSQLTPFVQFLFGTGCRTGEAIGLRWGDLSPDCGEVTIKSQITRRRRKLPKSGKTRRFKLNSFLQNILLDLKKQAQNVSSSTLVFQWNNLEICPKNFRSRVWITILKEVGVAYRCPYNTRHTFISHCLEKGMNPTAIAAITGHDVAVLFERYAGLVKQPQVPELF